MKKMLCEICGSDNLLKQDGLFVCQDCNAKYSVEEAKNLLVEVDPPAEDSAEKKPTASKASKPKKKSGNQLEKLYKAAENARETNNSQSAIQYYEKIAQMDPNAWEPLFYIPILRLDSIKNAEIGSAAVAVYSCLDKVFSLVAGNYSDMEQQLEIIGEIFNLSCDAAEMLAAASQNFFESLTYDKGKIMRVTTSYFDEHADRYRRIEEIMRRCGNAIERYFCIDNPDVQMYVAASWEAMLRMEQAFRRQNYNDALDDGTVNAYIKKIQKYDPNYDEMKPTPENTNSGGGGCYVATAVYGSYDCPQVWTLRRYRDNILAETWYGRAFIKTYYAISPTLVKWFGHAAWFRRFWKAKLDKMVSRLRAIGVEDTPYKDKNWK